MGTYTAVDRGRVPFVTGSVANVVPIVEFRHAWTVIDEENITVAQFIAADAPSFPVEVYAERVAELLTRHGLIDTPDTSEEIPT